MVKMVKTNLVFSTVTLITFLGLAKGTIISPPDGQKFVFLLGSSRNITWTLNNTGNFASRSWTFRTFDTPSLEAQPIVTITDDEEPDYRTSVLKSFGLDVEVFKPATLMLKKVNQSYIGVYKFSIDAPDPFGSSVNVSIAIKPTVSINCSSPLFVNESNDVSCVCKGEGGNPPANVTWFDKDDTTVRGFGVESATLVITGASPNDRGSYRCKAESFNDPRFIDERSIEIIVNFKPTVSIGCSSPLFVNESDGVSCVCRGEGGNPPASVTWFDKDNNIIGDVGVVSKTLVITNASPNDRGNYTCKAESFNDPRFIDEKSIEIRVNYKPRNTDIILSKSNPQIGENVTKTCVSDGFPLPTFIIHRNNDFFSNGTTYTIQSVNIGHKGEYHCIAMNKLGNDSSPLKKLDVLTDSNEGKIKNLSLSLVGLLFCIMYELSW
ncbi:hemicentin-2-like [Xenia sp. Carnegie-2017]|uniref:hemicentin-2-like n=1 Tax=Xenia sp. Carnegie-2017 TaxID=2897299 RepID=UPI001F039A88|nr:hemicentin-2-like [Xenia sp. Carnegie-2017]